MQRLITVIFIMIAAQACSSQIFSSVEKHNYDLNDKQLTRYGVALLTPATPTGNEEDKQYLAFSFTDAFNKLKPDIPITTLPEIIGLLNEHDLVNEYEKMYAEYKQTGIFRHEYLKKISEVIEVRYFIQLNLGHFNQNSSTRFSLLGLRMVDTHSTSIRVFMQVWDAWEGKIVWEGLLEIKHADDSMRQRTITFSLIVNDTVRYLIEKLP